MAEGDGLENRCVSNGTRGSNPLPSAVPTTIRSQRVSRLRRKCLRVVGIGDVA